VRPRAISRLQKFQTLRQPQWFRQLSFQILISAQREKTAVSRAAFDACHRTVPAVLAPKLLNAAKNSFPEIGGAGVRRTPACNRRPRAGQAAEMHKIQTFSAAERFQIRCNSRNWQFRLQRQQAIRSKNRVVKVAVTRAVFEAAIIVLLPAQKTCD